MVNVPEIRSWVKMQCQIKGKVHIHKQTGVVDVTGDVIFRQDVPFKQLPIQFGRVTGDFMCESGMLRSLKGSPTWVGGDFYCSYNALTTLTHAPTHVAHRFNCAYNQLTDLVGAPRHVGSHFLCYHNQLTSLTGAPRSVSGNFSCDDNQLTTLTHAPTHVQGLFSCMRNPLHTLHHAPDHVGGKMWCAYNPQLPLLRLLNYSTIRLPDAPDVLVAILNKHAGSGKQGALTCAAELLLAGFKDNARW